MFTIQKRLLVASLLTSSSIMCSSVSANEFDMRISDDAIHGNFSFFKKDEILKTIFGIGLLSRWRIILSFVSV